MGQFLHPKLRYSKKHTLFIYHHVIFCFDTFFLPKVCIYACFVVFVFSYSPFFSIRPPRTLENHQPISFQKRSRMLNLNEHFAFIGALSTLEMSKIKKYQWWGSSLCVLFNSLCFWKPVGRHSGWCVTVESSAIQLP